MNPLPNKLMIPVAGLLRLTCALVLLGLMGGCAWFGGDDDEPEDPPAELEKYTWTLKVKRAWSAGVGDGTEFLRLALAPATDGTNIYAGAHDGRAAAFTAEKGKKVWKVKTKLALSAGPAVDGDRVVFGTTDGGVIALNAGDGEEVWRATLASEVLAAPALTREHVVVRTVDGKLTALGRDDGEQRWTVQQSVPRLSVRGTAAPVVAGNLVVVGFDNGRLAAYEHRDGALAWDLMVSPPQGRTEVERLVDLNAGVLVTGDEAFTVGYQGSLASVGISTGQLIWSREMSSYNGLGADVTSLYVAEETSALGAYSRRSGREFWRHEQLRRRDITAPAAYGSSVVVGDFEGYVHWFGANTGSPQARAKTDKSRIVAPPLVLNDLVYVLTEKGKLYAFRTTSIKPK